MKDSAMKIEGLDISGVIWDKDIPEMVKAMKGAGVTEFTISDTSCGIVRTLAVFEENGAKLQGLTSVKSGWCDFDTGEPKMKPAFLMKIM
ncbi:MAG: hypothetical protein II832_03330 [Synergistaceae bacterium]|nr:hypothetical protein [Synergistaceae bacterium]